MKKGEEMWGEREKRGEERKVRKSVGFAWVSAFNHESDDFYRLFFCTIYLDCGRNQSFLELKMLCIRFLLEISFVITQSTLYIIKNKKKLKEKKILKAIEGRKKIVKVFFYVIRFCKASIKKLFLDKFIIQRKRALCTVHV